MGLVSSAAATSTTDKRRASWRHWLAFIKESGGAIEPLKPSELEVCLWLVYLSKKELAYSTIKVYLYALSSEIKMRGGNPIVKYRGSWFIQNTLKALEKRVGSGETIFRRPLTVPIMESVVGSLKLSEHNDLLFGTMIAVGVYGMFRINELCFCRKGTVTKFISNKDVVFNSDHAIITIFMTKTDKVVKKIIGSIPKAKFDPFELLKAYKSIKTSSWRKDEGFFVTKEGKDVSRAMLVGFMQKKLASVHPHINPREWNGISLRKGGATSAMQAGVPGEIIQQMGHWKSAVYQRYIHVDTNDVINAQRKAGTNAYLIAKDGGI